MIARIRLCNGSVFSALLPIKLARVNDYTAERRAVTADKFRSRMNDNIRTVFNRSYEIRSAEGVVNDKRKSVLVCDFGDFVNIGNIAVGIAEGFDINRLCFGLYGTFELVKVVCVDKACADAEAANNCASGAEGDYGTPAVPQ